MGCMAAGASGPLDRICNRATGLRNRGMPLSGRRGRRYEDSPTRVGGGAACEAGCGWSLGAQPANWVPTGMGPGIAMPPSRISSSGELFWCCSSVMTVILADLVRLSSGPGATEFDRGDLCARYEDA